MLTKQQDRTSLSLPRMVYGVVIFGLGGDTFQLESHYKLELARLPV